MDDASSGGNAITVHASSKAILSKDEGRLRFRINQGIKIA
jgi:hypothetical protein